MSRSVISTIIFALLPLGAEAALWSSTNAQWLHGSRYELGERERSIITLEHANGWQYGDTFFFIDITSPTGGDTSHYAEFSPRISLGKTLDSKPFWKVKDTFIAATLEMGENVNAQLIGVGAAFDVSGFDYFNVNLYHRTSHRDWINEQTGSGAQVTITWRYPFVIAGQAWQFGGFLDYAFNETGGTSPKSDNLMTAPQLLLDVGKLVWKTDNSIYAGIEHQIWRNKFGVNGVDEDVTQTMIKWVF